MTSSIEGFKRVFGEFKEIKEGEMELTTRVLAVSDKKPEKRTFKIAIDGSEVWASFWYSSKFGEAPESVVDAIKSIRTGDEVTFDLRQSGDWWNINGVMPVNDVHSETREPAGQARPVDISAPSSPMLSLNSINICAQVAVKEGFATFRSAMSSGADVDAETATTYCSLAMGNIMRETAKYAGGNMEDILEILSKPIDEFQGE